MGSSALITRPLSSLGHLGARGPCLGLSDAVEERQCLSDYLVHVVVAVGPQSASEVYLGRGIGKLLVALVERGVLLARNGVVWVAVGARKLVHHRRRRVFLAGQVLELRDASITAHARFLWV